MSELYAELLLANVAIGYHLFQSHYNTHHPKWEELSDYFMMDLEQFLIDPFSMENLSEVKNVLAHRMEEY